MKVKIQFISASVPTEFDGVKDVYTKDGLVCVSFVGSKRIIKFPLVNVFSIESEYEHGEGEKEERRANDERA